MYPLVKSRSDLIITLAWTISVYDADADLPEDTYKNIYKFWVDRTMNK
jgi:hypothetical protein